MLHPTGEYALNIASPKRVNFLLLDYIVFYLARRVGPQNNFYYICAIIFKRIQK